jgi:hypothetical protein
MVRRLAEQEAQLAQRRRKGVFGGHDDRLVYAGVGELNRFSFFFFISFPASKRKKGWISWRKKEWRRKKAPFLRSRSFFLFFSRTERSFETGPHLQPPQEAFPR